MLKPRLFSKLTDLTTSALERARAWALEPITTVAGEQLAIERQFQVMAKRNTQTIERDVAQRSLCRVVVKFVASGTFVQGVPAFFSQKTVVKYQVTCEVSSVSVEIIVVEHGGAIVTGTVTCNDQRVFGSNVLGYVSIPGPLSEGTIIECALQRHEPAE